MADVAMVGRDRELRRCADAAQRPGCVGVILVGPAGVGKSALANACATGKVTNGAELVRIAATKAASTIPLGAVAPLLSLPNAPSAQADLIRHTVAALTLRAAASHAEGRELVMLIDDAHLLDDASATLVHQLALAGEVFLIVTIRSEEIVSDPVTALWKDGLAERLDIAVLGLAESTELASAIVGGPIAPSAATVLFEASGGNPLFLQQLVASARDVGALVPVAGRGPVPGRWSLVAALPLPADLVSAVEARLEHLEHEDRAVVELLALGEPLDAGLLEDLAGDDGDARLERLEAEGFIAATQDQHRLTVRLAHPMYGEVLRANMPTTWANRARLLLADALADRPLRRHDDAIRVATWRLDAHATIPADIAAAAAQQALLRFDFELAERIVRNSNGYRPATEAAAGVSGRVCGSVIGTSGSADGDPEAEMLLATIAAFASRAESALSHLDELDRLLDRGDHDGRLRSRAAVLRFDVLSYILGRFEDAFALEVPADGDPSIGSALTARKALVAVTLAQPRLAESLLATVPAVERGTHADLWVSVVWAMTHAARGRLQQSLDLAEQVEATFADLRWEPSLPDPALAVYVRIRVLQNLGRLHDAHRLGDLAISFENDRWSAQAVAWIRSASSSVQRMMGRPSAAAAAAEDSAIIFERSAALQLATVALAERAAALAALGDAEAAAETARRADEFGIDNFYTRSAHAWAAVASGRISDGIAMLIQLLASRRGREAREETLLVLDIVRLGGATEVADTAAELAGRVDGDLVQVVAEFARASASDDGPALERVADRLDELGFGLPAAEAAMAACAAHLRAGEQRRCKAFLPRADELCGSLRNVRTPGLHPPHVQAQLAPREREVVSLAVTGASSRAVADLLGLSHRTVESYVQAAYDKLGVSTRAELAVVMGITADPVTTASS